MIGIHGQLTAEDTHNPILKAHRDCYHVQILEKRKATLVHTLTLCPICLSIVKEFFIKNSFDLEKIKEKIKALMYDQCSYNPNHNPEQIFYRTK